MCETKWELHGSYWVKVTQLCRMVCMAQAQMQAPAPQTGQAQCDWCPNSRPCHGPIALYDVKNHGAYWQEWLCTRALTDLASHGYTLTPVQTAPAQQAVTTRPLPKVTGGTTKIWVPNNGKWGNDSVEIQIPASCPHCGQHLDLKRDDEPLITWVNNACDHTNTWGRLWDMRIVAPGAATPDPAGYNCKRCNTHNPWAEPNQKDGTYVCYSCRGP